MVTPPGGAGAGADIGVVIGAAIGGVAMALLVLHVLSRRDAKKSGKIYIDTDPRSVEADKPSGPQKGEDNPMANSLPRPSELPALQPAADRYPTLFNSPASPGADAVLATEELAELVRKLEPLSMTKIQLLAADQLVARLVLVVDAMVQGRQLEWLMGEAEVLREQWRGSEEGLDVAMEQVRKGKAAERRRSIQRQRESAAERLEARTAQRRQARDAATKQKLGALKANMQLRFASEEEEEEGRGAASPSGKSEMVGDLVVTRLESPQKRLPPISGSKGAGAGSSLKSDLRKRFGDDGGAGGGGV